MNRKLLAVAVAGTVAPMVAQAVDLSVSGRVDRIIRFADNGAQSDIQHLDHGGSPSRFTIGGEGEPMPGITAGASVEANFRSNSASDVDKGDGDDSTSIRHTYVYFSGDFGNLTLGHTTEAGDVMYQSHNGAWLGTEFSADSNSGISVGGSALTVGSYFNHGELWADRADVLRYTTPAIGPVTLDASVRKADADDHQWRFGAKLSSDFGGSNLIAGVVVQEDVLGVAGGLAFPQGTSVNFAWGSDDDGDRDYETFYANVAHTWGNTSVAIQYLNASEDSTGREGQSVGLGVNQSLGSGVDVFAGFNNYSFDDSSTADFEDVNAFHIGTMVKFN